MSRSGGVSLLGIFGFSILAMSLAGCRSGTPSGDIDAEKKHIFHVVELVSQYTTATKKRPTKVDEVREWTVKEGKGSEDDFNSTRDKQPYGVSNTEGMGVIVYEQTGKNGKCYFFRMGNITEMKQEEVANAAKGAQAVGPSPGTKKSMGMTK